MIWFEYIKVTYFYDNTIKEYERAYVSLREDIIQIGKRLSCGLAQDNVDKEDLMQFILFQLEWIKSSFRSNLTHLTYFYSAVAFFGWTIIIISIPPRYRCIHWVNHF